LTTPIDIFAGEQQFRLQVQTRFAEPVKLPTATTANVDTLYPPADWQWCMVAITNGTSNRHIAISDGTNWRYSNGGMV